MILWHFTGIEAFSHLWLVWQFHDNKSQDQTDKFRPQVRPPRLGGNKSLGCLQPEVCTVQRQWSCHQIVSLSKKWAKHCEFMLPSDLLDGTPILDIKPYIHYSDAIPHAQSGYAQEEATSQRSKLVGRGFNKTASA